MTNKKSGRIVHSQSIPPYYAVSIARFFSDCKSFSGDFPSKPAFSGGIFPARTGKRDAAARSVPPKAFYVSAPHPPHTAAQQEEQQGYHHP